ncbi:hypothetical protein QYE76_009295 [Lolium multiflorum]|uniref:Uncharacterized protein n=1 Tax=Lolium multiflorum TaxID=4521 RepID=A0AAD8X0T5_LOLMU|nr:hypothetical protein QYE76_009295 [Lolium multiflorum]
MVKKKSVTTTASSTSGGAATKSSSTLPKGSASSVPLRRRRRQARQARRLAPTVTKRDEKRSRSLGLISSDEGNVILPEAANIPADALDKVPNNSPSNGLSMALASQQLTDVYFPLLFL